MSVIVEAVLDHDADITVSPRTGEAALILRALLPPNLRGKALQVRARKSYGTGPAAQYVCRRAADDLRRGTRVRLHGQTMTWLRGAIELSGVEQVETPDITRAPRAYLET